MQNTFTVGETVETSHGEAIVTSVAPLGIGGRNGEIVGFKIIETGFRWMENRLSEYGKERAGI